MSAYERAKGIDPCEKCVCGHARWLHQDMSGPTTVKPMPKVPPRECSKCECLQFTPTHPAMGDEGAQG